MAKLFKLDVRSIIIGVALFCALYLLITQAVNTLSIPNSTLNTQPVYGVLALLPFLLSGYITSIRSYPSGVFNSALVGVVSGILVAIYAHIKFGGLYPAYTNTIGLLGGITSSLVLCSLGGVLGTVTRYYRQ